MELPASQGGRFKNRPAATITARTAVEAAGDEAAVAAVLAGLE